MRILHLLNHCADGNGHVHVAVDLACEQTRRGATVAVASAGGPYEALFARRGIAHLHLDQNNRGLARVPVLLRDLSRILDEFAPDVCHAHMMTGAVLAFPLTRLRRLGLVTHIHNSFERNAYLMGLGDRVIAVSTAVADQMARRGIARDKIRVVLNGTIGSARLDPVSPPPADLSHPAIVTLCGLHERKGVRDLIAGFDIVARRNELAHLYIVGSGPQQPLLETFAGKTYAPSRIHFVGADPEPRPYLRAADLFVLASHADPCPLVIFEAREAGCAIAASNVDGIPEALDWGEAGELFPPRDPAAMAEKMLLLLENPQRMAHLRAKARQGSERFTVARLCDEVEAVYRETMRANAPTDTARVKFATRP